MIPLDYIILGIVLAGLAAAAAWMIRQRKNGRRPGCGTCCGGCTGCNRRYPEK